MIDLHVHSNKSDGTYSPKELVDYAIEKGLSAFALTDHDCTDGICEAREYAQGKNLEIIPGIELSSEYHNIDIHIVGLFINVYAPNFEDTLQEFKDSRIARNIKMCKKLTEAGIEISYEELMKENPDAVVTRAHYAQLMVKKGYVKSKEEAFDRYIGDHCPYFVPREKITPQAAVQFIKNNGGIAVLAHPTLYSMGYDKLKELVISLKEAGLDAIETKYSTYTGAQERKMRNLAKELMLLQSGGSDFHGERKPGLDLAVGYGGLYIDDSILTDLKQAIPKKILFSDLDNTLLNDNKDIDSENLDAIRNMTDKGHRFVISTGRPLSSAIQIAKRYGWFGKGYYISCFNGGLIYNCENMDTIVRNPIALSMAQLILDEAHKAGLHAHTYDSDHVISEYETEDLKNYSKIINVQYKIVDRISDYFTEDPMKVIVVADGRHDALVSFRNHMKELLGDCLYTTFSHPSLLEFANKDSNKGYAVQYLAKYFGSRIEYTIGCGDEENDIPMIQVAQIGVAMSNASDEIKQYADYITENDNNHNAIAEVISRMIM